MKKVKVLLISSEYPPGPGGIGQHAYCLAKSLHEDGIELFVLSPADYTTEKEVQAFDKKQEYFIERYPRLNPLINYINRLKITYKLIKNQVISHVILTGKFSLWQGVFIKLLNSKIKTISILHGSEVNLENKWLRKFTHYAINKSDVLLPVSKFTKSLLPDFILNNPKKIIEVIPNGIIKELFPESNNQNINLKGNPKLLTVGHVSPRKGQQRVIKALPEIIKKYPEVHYHIVGRNLHQKQFEELAKKLKVDSYLTFHGRVKEFSDLPKYYQSSDIFMLLSENLSNGDVEGYGIVALEANYYGIPVVGAKYCGVEDAVKNEFSGVLVDGNNADEIVQAIDFCMENKNNLQESSKHWADQHQWNHLIGRITQYLK